MSSEHAGTSTRLQPIVMLPCPFCGEQPHGVFGPNEDNGLWRVECFGQNYGCGDWTVEADSRDEVREAWNKRPECQRWLELWEYAASVQNTHEPHEAFRLLFQRIDEEWCKLDQATKQRTPAT